MEQKPIYAVVSGDQIVGGPYPSRGLAEADRYKGMEEILKQLQAIQVEAFKMKVAIFYITTFHWDDEGVDAIVVRACKTDGDDDVFYGRLCSDNLDDTQAVITHLKIYLGL